MARTPDLERKPELLAQILEYLLDKSLSSLSFRTLAKALEVSTFTLVYQFGTRAELIREIVHAISARSDVIQDRLEGGAATLDTYFEGLAISWEWTVEPRNRALQRLEFEAGLMESLHPAEHTFARGVYEHWQHIGQAALRSFGMSERDAAIESRLLIDTFQGIQYDLVLNDDEKKATAAFTRAMEHHRARIEAMLGLS